MTKSQNSLGLNLGSNVEPSQNIEESIAPDIHLSTDVFEEEEEKSLFPLSKSKLTTFKYCPYQFYLKYILGQRDDPNHSMVVGTRFHDFAYQYFHVRDMVEDPYTLIHDDYTPQEKDRLRWFIKQEEARKSFYDPSIYTPFVMEEDIHNTDLEIHGFVDRVDIIDINMVPYLEEEIPRISKRILKNFDKGKKSLCIYEYKTGGKPGADPYIQGIRTEVSFYKLCMQGDPRFDDYDIVCGCVINPTMEKIVYMGFEYEKTTLALINSLKNALNTNEFPRTCTYNKHQRCMKCTLEEAGLWHSDEWWDKTDGSTVSFYNGFY